MEGKGRGRQVRAGGRKGEGEGGKGSEGIGGR